MMTPERYKEVGCLYRAALELEPTQRAAYLAEACGGDDALRQEVASLLDYEGRGERLIDQPALEAAAQAMAEDQIRDAVASPAPSLIGKSVGHFRILSLVGKGGMGEVWLAEDRHLSRKVAVKLLPAEFTTQPERVRRFAQEARAASALNHPNIITIYEIGEVNTEVGATPYIVTEYIAGETLRQRIEDAPERKLPPAEVVEIAAQIAAALSAAHEAGIVHRDIKPENVMVRRDGLVKVLDFGLARVIEQPTLLLDPQAPTAVRNSTETGVVMGTPRYMSPEQARGQKVDASTDIFSLGVMLYEMVAGQAPFARATTSETIAAILRDEPPPLSRYTTQVPHQLERIVSQAMRKDRAERHQTVKDLLGDLNHLKQELLIAEPPYHNRQDGPALPSVTTRKMLPTTSSVSVPAARGKRSIIVLGVLALLVPVLIWIGISLNSWVKKRVEIDRLEFQGSFYLGRWTEDEIRKGIEYYNRAIALDPNSGSAYQGLAAGWTALSDLHLSPREAMPKAKAAIVNALQRDEASAPTHITLGLIKVQYEWDWAGAEQEMKRAIELDPESNSAHQLYGWYLIAVGRFDEAQAEMKRAMGTNPLNDFGLWGLGDSFYFARQYEQAIEQYRRAIGVEPKLYWSHLMLGCAYEQQGKFSDAITELNQAYQLNNCPQVLAALGRAYAASGRRADGHAVIAELQETSRQRYVSPYDVATIYAGLGENDQAFAWLEKAFDDRSGWLALWLKVDPKFDGLRRDARFQDLLRRIGQAN